MRTFYIVLFFLLIGFNGFGQKALSPYDSVSHAILIVPQYAAVSGVRVDYERKLKNGDNWLVFSPQLFLDNNGISVADELTGFGLNISYKKFLHHSSVRSKIGTPNFSWYFLTGPIYQRISLINIDQVPVPFIENDVEYLRFEERDVKTPISRFGGSAIFGLQINRSRFIFDLYGGIGVRYSIDENGEMFDFFNDYWTDFGYSGILLEGGVRFGFFI